MTLSELRKLARERLKDAKILLERKRFDSAAYICGYAMELGLKARICKTLRWNVYNVSEDFKSFKTHKLSALLEISGVREKIARGYIAEWSIVVNWNAEWRYEPFGHMKPETARDMITATSKLLKAL